VRGVRPATQRSRLLREGADDDADDDGHNVVPVTHEAVTECAYTHPDGTRWVWGTETVRASFDLSYAIRENLQDEGMHEDAFDQAHTHKLNVAQQLIDEALADVVSYFEDRSVAVVLP
jgi:hypothetical protein